MKQGDNFDTLNITPPLIDRTLLARGDEILWEARTYLINERVAFKPGELESRLKQARADYIGHPKRSIPICPCRRIRSEVGNLDYLGQLSQEDLRGQVVSRTVPVRIPQVV